MNGFFRINNVTVETLPSVKGRVPMFVLKRDGEEIERSADFAKLCASAVRIAFAPIKAAATPMANDRARKIAELRDRAATPGEREAAEAALRRAKRSPRRAGGAV